MSGTDLTAAEALAMIEDIDIDKAFAMAVACLLRSHLGNTYAELQHKVPAELNAQSSCGLKQFLDLGGEIHCITGGKHPGEVLGVDREAEAGHA